MAKINVFEELGTVGDSFGEFINTLAMSSALEDKTHHLAYLAVLAAKGMHDGIPFHVQELAKLKATRDEVKSAVLVSMPVIGMEILTPLTIALESYDNYQEATV